MRKKILRLLTAFMVILSIWPSLNASATTIGMITTVAGTDIGGYNNDDQSATTAELNRPTGVAIDAAGNLYIADANNNRIRKVDTEGNISTVAGTGTDGYSGDNGPATDAQLNYPMSVAVDADGNLYIADCSNHRIRKVDTKGTITTVAGIGSAGGTGDGGLAPDAQLNYPKSIAVDADGNLYIADSYNHRIRKVDTKGTITTVAGTGTDGYNGDNGPATDAQLNTPTGVAVDATGSLYIADFGNSRIRKVDTKGNITTVAGTGTDGYSGDNGPATDAQLNYPMSVAVDATGNLYIVNWGNSKIQKVDTKGNITTVAGTGTGYNGDNRPATDAWLDSPYGVAIDAAGNLYIADGGNNRIRKVMWAEAATTPTVITDSTVSNLTSTGATVGGEVTADGGSTITERGVVYATSDSPTISNNKETATGTTDTITVNLSGLTPNTTYHYRAYATNSVGTSYGSDQTFTTASQSDIMPPVVSHIDVNPTTPTNGDVTVTVTATDDKGIALTGGYSFDGGITWQDSNSKTYSENTTTPVTPCVKDSSGNIGYYDIAYDISNIDKIKPQITAGTVSRTIDAEATVTFTTDQSGKYYYEVVDKGASAPTIDTTGVGTTMSAGENTIDLTGISAGAKEIYIQAKDAAGNVSTPLKMDIAATQAAIIPAVTTDSTVSNLTSTGTTVGGEVTSDNGATITERGVVYSTSDSPTISNAKETASGTTGTFTVNLSGLMPNTTYHYRAYATNDEGTSYGDEKTFTTTTSASNPPSSGGSGGSDSFTSTSNTEQLVVDVEGNNGKELTQTPVTRTTETDGTVKDNVTMSDTIAKDTVEKVKEQGSNTARIVIPDAADKVSETRVDIPKTALSELNSGEINLEISTENAVISIPTTSLENVTDDLYFRVVPIKKESERQKVEDRANNEQVVQEVAKGVTVQVLGRPMTIETNMSNHPVDLILPLKGVTIPEQADEREAFLKNLGVYIEHSDGEKVFQKGEVVTYKNGELGLKFTVTKFSTFTLIHIPNKVPVKNDPPMVTNLQIIGKPKVGTTLKATYTYKDANHDHQGKSIIQWYRMNPKTNKQTAIKGATKTTYKVTSKDEGKKIIFEVKPIAKTGMKTGKIVMSKKTAVVKVEYKSRFKLGAIQNKDYAKRIVSILEKTYKAKNVTLKKAGAYYYISADFIDKKQSKKVGEDLINRKLIIHYYVTSN